MIHGISITTYWLANFIFDILKYQIFLAFTIAIIFMFDIKILYQGGVFI